MCSLRRRHIRLKAYAPGHVTHHAHPSHSLTSSACLKQGNPFAILLATLKHVLCLAMRCFCMCMTVHQAVLDTPQKPTCTGGVMPTRTRKQVGQLGRDEGPGGGVQRIIRHLVRRQPQLQRPPLVQHPGEAARLAPNCQGREGSPELLEVSTSADPCDTLHCWLPPRSRSSRVQNADIVTGLPRSCVLPGTTSKHVKLDMSEQPEDMQQRCIGCPDSTILPSA